jgi:siderophore synthetase component
MSYDPATLAAAEQAVRDLIRKTTWASDANLLKRAANAVRDLNNTTTDTIKEMGA